MFLVWARWSSNSRMISCLMALKTGSWVRKWGHNSVFLHLYKTVLTFGSFLWQFEFAYKEMHHYQSCHIQLAFRYHSSAVFTLFWSFQNPYEFLYSVESTSSFFAAIFCSQALTMKLLGHYSLKIFPFNGSSQILFILIEAFESGCSTALMSTVSHAIGSCVSCVWLWHIWINERTAVEILSEKLFFTQNNHIASKGLEYVGMCHIDNFDGYFCVLYTKACSHQGL